jgi:DNA gyrase subunit A
MEKIVPVIIEDEMKRSYIDYAMSVIVSRAIPDVRDGLKPVHRRILYAMHELGLTPDKPFKKSATVVGETLGKFHPHGDLAVYDAITRMVQDFSLRYPLVDGQGNFGSIDGDAAAAYRYTEIRLSKLALYLLKDIEKNTVDFIPNFDGRLKEPVVLPSSFPNLVINGTSGIAVAMATNIPPHNMGEVIDALIAIIKDPDADPLSYIKGPDFPTGGVIVGKKGIIDYALTGKGRVVVKARVTVEKTKRGKAICITEIPYQVNKSILIERIAGIIKEKKIGAVTALRDESDRKGMRIVIELKKTSNEELILNNLYKHTPMRITFGVNLLALKSGVPSTLPLKKMLVSFLEYRYEVVERRTRFELERAEKKAHILEGLKIAVDNIEEVVDIIKKAKTTKDAKDNLMRRFNLTDVQAQAILDMKLSRLVGLEREKLENEYVQVIKEIERLRLILSSKREIYEVIGRDLLEIKEKFADERRTEIVEEEEKEFAQEDLIPDIDVVVILTKRGYIKRCPLNTYRTQARGGRGTSGIKLTPDDVVSQVIATTNHARLILFTEKGKAFSLKVYEILEGSRISRGRSINNLLGLSEDDRVISAVSPNSDVQAVLITTKLGTIKKIDIERLRNIRRNGVIVIRLKENDVTIGVEGVSKDKEIILATRDGKASRINETEVRMMGRSAQGVIGMRLEKDDYIVTLVSPCKRRYLFTVTQDGYGKRIKVNKIRKTRRGSKGVRMVKGILAGVVPVDDDSEVICVTQNGQVIKIKLKKVRIMGRVARGVRVITLKEGDKVIAVDKVEK